MQNAGFRIKLIFSTDFLSKFGGKLTNQYTLHFTWKTISLRNYPPFSLSVHVSHIFPIRPIKWINPLAINLTNTRSDVIGSIFESAVYKTQWCHIWCHSFIHTIGGDLGIVPWIADFKEVNRVYFADVITAEVKRFAVRCFQAKCGALVYSSSFEPDDLVVHKTQSLLHVVECDSSIVKIWKKNQKSQL